MLDDEKVLAAFAAMWEMTQEEAAPWQALCAACARRLEGRLRGGIFPEKGAGALTLAAAAMAGHRRALQEGGDWQLRLGEIEARENGGALLERARALEREYLALAGEYLRPEGMAFVRTQG